MGNEDEARERDGRKERERESLSIGTAELCVTPNGDGIGFRAIIDELGETGGRFGEYLCVDCGNLPLCKLTQPNYKRKIHQT